MTLGTKRAKTTDGTMQAAKHIERDASFIESTAEIIDRASIRGQDLCRFFRTLIYRFSRSCRINQGAR
jgi:hypothetical protein